MVGAAIPSQAAAMQAVMLGGFLLVFMLSGLMFPIENIPAGLRWISNFVWGRYYIEIVRDALLARRRLARGLVQSARSSRSSAAIFYVIGWWRMRRMQL